MSWDPNPGFPNLLTLDRYIGIDDVIEQIIDALHGHKGWSIVRWGDGENRIMEEGSQCEAEFRHVGNFLSLRYYNEFGHHYLCGVAAADVLGFFPNDWWTCRVLHARNIDIAGKPLVYAWCNRHWNARREWGDEVLGKPWRTVLVGNMMAQYQPVLAGFSSLEVIANFPALDYPDVKTACGHITELKPQLVLASVGWYAPLVVNAAKSVGAVGLDYGHCPDYHINKQMIPNTCCPRGPEGCRQHYAHGNFADAIHQERPLKRWQVDVGAGESVDE